LVFTIWSEAAKVIINTVLKKIFQKLPVSGRKLTLFFV